MSASASDELADPRPALPYVDHTAAPAARVAAMTRWEYATTPVLMHNTQAILNTWGADGWELVQVVTMPEGGNLVAYFKRPQED
ncbi:hypothetical protein KEM60_01118 [Austwickia sp. TVS 96-490-7B]|uniref:DUF4177 domain-containing protein n=1 Tax=Austwickia sp. TVS 96-490-7B TaxID=2830843 RepID=UPI001D359471|nr:DUF4177 domain-containing protein [Austwickia sp. TVS 96-490-7B]MBW3084928.1 hypothetical protein [Austwickia sp. TVS 96-490-7B]